MKNKVAGFAIVALAFVPAFSKGVSAAETAPTPDVSAQKATQTLIFPLRYAKPSFLAWQLDPKNHANPQTVRGRRETQLTEEAEKQSILPEGVENIIAIDARGQLVAQGSEEGLRHLKTLIESLDKPLVQVEFEVKTVQMSVSEAREIARTATRKVAPSFSNVLFVTENVAPKIAALIDGNKARVFNAPRVTTADEVTVQVSSSNEGKITIISRVAWDKDGNIQYVPVSMSNGGWMKRSIIFSLTPRVNADDTISLALNYKRTMGMGAGKEKIKPGVIRDKSIQVSMKSNETFTVIDLEPAGMEYAGAYSGKTWAKRIESLERTSTADVFLVTPHIIRPRQTAEYSEAAR